MKTIFAAALLGILVATAAGQDKPEANAKAPFEWKIEGDSIETFKATLVVNQKVDQSTARGAVEAYLGFTDGRDESRKASKASSEQWDALVAKELAGWEEKLLSAEARAALAAARKEKTADDPLKDRTAPATEITAESKAEDGSVLIETLQKTTDRAPDKTGKMNESTREDKQRFSCTKGEDGKWRVGKIEQWRNDYDPETQKQTWVWKQSHGMMAYMYTVGDNKPAEAAEPKQDTPENAALSIYNSLIARQDDRQQKVMSLLMPDWFKQIEALVTPVFVEGAKKEAQEVAKFLKDATKTASGTESVTDGKDGAKIVKFKKSDTWRTDVQATVKQVDGKWVIVEAGIWENVGGIDRGPQYRAMGDIYRLPKP